MDPGTICLFRQGVLVEDFGKDRVTAEDFGRGILAAFQATQPGDDIQMGPLRASVSNATLRTSNVQVLCHGTTIVPNGKYGHLLQVQGNDCVVDGLTVDGLATPNAGTGMGLLVTGHRNRLVRCMANGCRGANVTNGHGSGLKVEKATDTLVLEYSSDDAGYAALWLMGANRTTVNGASITNPYRSISINSTTSLNWINISNVVATCTRLGTSSLINSNITDGVSLGLLQMNNVSLVDTDMVSPGVSYDQTAGHQMAKFQNIERLVLDKVRLEHGRNAGSGAIRSFYLQEYMGNKAPEELLMTDCYLSDCMVISLKVGYWHMEGCTVGATSLQNYTSAFRPNVQTGRFIGNNFNIHRNRFVLTPDMNLADGDHLEFRYNRFVANVPSPAYVHKVYPSGEISVDKTNMMVNQGGGGFDVSP
jgi:hypothetical protein